MVKSLMIGIAIVVAAVSGARARARPPESSLQSASDTQHPARPQARRTRTPVDSVRGTIGIGGAGTCATAQVYLTTAAHKTVTVDGSRDIFSQLIGKDVVVFGKRRNPPPGHPYLAHPIIKVDSFLVRAHDAKPARDGILRRRPTGDMLQVRNGRRLPIANLPGALAKADGMRVWIAGPLGSPASAGVIDPKHRYFCAE